MTTNRVTKTSQKNFTLKNLAGRKTAEITVETDTYQITVEDGITITAPRTTSRDINRHKASNYDSRQC